MPKPRGRPNDKDKRFERSDLLALAYREFADKGFDGVSIRKLATQLEVSDSLFIHHFGSKRKLWYEVVDTIIEREFQVLRASLRVDKSLDNPLALLRTHITEFLNLAKRRPAMFRLLFAELDADNERAEYLKSNYLIPYVAVFDRAISLCKERNEIKPISNHSLHTLVLGSVKILLGPAILQHGIPAQSRDPHADTIMVDDLVEMIFSGALLSRS